jgi:hypothetical protein
MIESKLSNFQASAATNNVRNFERVCQFVVLLMGARCAYAGRHLLPGADGLAYLDVARSYARQDWHTAINGYWGPLYAWLLAIFVRLFRPGMRNELAIAQALNFVLFAAALYLFGRFWRAVGAWGTRISKGNSIPAASPLVWITLGYLLFVVDFVWPVDTINPDILVASLVFAIGSLLFTLDDDSQSGIATYAWLGVLLAIGYYAKTIMLYFAVYILAAILFRGWRWQRLRGPIVSAVIFVVLVAPFVVILSLALGHITAGDSGRLNYAWFVNGTETKTWMKDPDAVVRPGAPVPFYPGAIASDSPRVFRNPSMQGITYAPWYDAARFDVRTHPAIDFHNQLRQLAINLRYVKEQLLCATAAVTVPLIFLLWNRPRESLSNLASTWYWTVPALAIFGMYLLVHLVERFVIGFSLLLWGAAWASVFVPKGFELVARRAILAGMMVFAAYTLPGLVHYVVSTRANSSGEDVAIAQALPGFGVSPGDGVASIGDGQEAYWAHLANVPVVAEVWSIESAQFWSASQAKQDAVLRAMANAGAKVAVSRAELDRPCPPNWLSLPQSSGCVMLLGNFGR